MTIRKFSGLQVSFCFFLILICSSLADRGEAQLARFSYDGQRHHSAAGVQAEDLPLPALMVSDVHFDPFHDPAKVQQLIESPVSQWDSILSAPASPNQSQAFASLQQSCGARGVDTPYALLESSLQAMRAQQPNARFVTVSGDLIAHAFSCRYTTLFAGSTQSDYQDFVLKTLSFVMRELRAAFPSIPIYASLGNNDTACGDYRLDPESDFLVKTGRIVAEGLPSPQKQQALRVFAKGGYYSIKMEAPMHNTRLIVINDIFLSPKYSTCAGKVDSVGAAAEIEWLQEQLGDARRLGQRVWVMGHIPPGVDPYSTVAKIKNVCGNETPEMFLSSDKLADLLIEYADVIRLGIFAHSHMDEMRLLERTDRGAHGSFEHSVAIKVVPSISPVDGNNPSFIVAQVNRSSAVLLNYQLIAASNQTGIAAAWTREYDYDQTYNETQFSPSTVKELITEFVNDRGAKTKDSQNYIRYYFVGDRSSELKPFWPQYVCALANHTAKTFSACECSAGK